MTASGPAPHRVRSARASELRAMSLVLARAFRDDPVHRWMLPGEFDWAIFSAPIFAAVVRESLHADGTDVSDGLEGVACWFPPYPPPAPAWRRLQMLVVDSLALGRRAGPVLRELARLSEARPVEPHWYLTVLGCDPRHQGRGVGSALLEPVLKRCDADRIPAYLESSKPSNVPFYERHGFRLIGEIEFDDGPTLGRMLREPRP